MTNSIPSISVAKPGTITKKAAKARVAPEIIYKQVFVFNKLTYS